MRKIRDILRLRQSAGLSIRQINASTKASVGAIQKLLTTADELGLSWPLPPELDDNQLARLFYPGADTRASTRYQVPDWSVIHQELKRKGMTKQLLWEEYTQQYPNRCYSYSQFCDRYAHWQGLQKRSMRQLHKAGEKCFVDYCGPTVPIVYAESGENHQAQVFVAVLGASNYTYAEATWSQALPDWLGAMCGRSSIFGGCARDRGPGLCSQEHNPGYVPIFVMWLAVWILAPFAVSQPVACNITCLPWHGDLPLLLGGYHARELLHPSRHNRSHS